MRHARSGKGGGGIRIPRKLTVSVVMAVLVLVGCAQDPTATDEYTRLEEELAAADAALAEVEGAAGLTAEVRSVQEEWFAAWNAKDGDAVRSMMVFGGRHYCPATGTNGASGADLVALVEEGWQMTDAEIVSATRTQTPGDPAVVSDDYVDLT